MRGVACRIRACRKVPGSPWLPGEPPTAHPHHHTLERFNQKIECRMRVGRIFPTRESCLRLVTALGDEVSEEWVTGRRYLDIEELCEHWRLEELVVESRCSDRCLPGASCRRPCGIEKSHLNWPRVDH